MARDMREVVSGVIRAIYEYAFHILVYTLIRMRFGTIAEAHGKYNNNLLFISPENNNAWQSSAVVVVVVVASASTAAG